MSERELIVKSEAASGELAVFSGDIERLLCVWKRGLELLEGYEGIEEGDFDSDELPSKMGKLRMNEASKKMMKLSEMREFMGIVKTSADVAKTFYEFIPKKEVDVWDKFAAELGE